jgi:hypothetical protein
MILPAHANHVQFLQLTPEGIAELAAVYDMTPAEALRRNLAASSEAWTMFADDEVLAMFGVAPLSILERKGEFWIAGSVNICRHKLSFARQCRRFLPQLLKNWSEVVGILEHQRADVVRWAQWMGVQITPRDMRTSFMSLKAS